MVALDQLPKLLGIHIPKGTFVKNLLAVARGIPETSMPTLAVALAMIALLFAIERFLPRAPAPLAHWAVLFANVDCCVTPVNTLDEALVDPQFVARGMIVERPDGSRQYAPPFKLSGHEFAVTREAPAQGEHTAEVLREAGYDDAAIAALAADGVIVTKR
jgi:hypothetical protein